MNSKGLFLVNPNLGHPKILNIDRNLTQQNFKTDLLFITNIKNPIKIKEHLFNNIKIIPLFEYKWKIKQLIERRGLRKKVKDFWKNVKSFFSFKKKEKGFEISIEEVDKSGNEQLRVKRIKKKELRKIKPRPFRGKSINTKILKVESISPIDIDKIGYIDDQYCKPQKYLKKLEVFGNLEYFYSISLEFNLTNDILEFLSNKNFIMFDILYRNFSLKNKINYHALVISKNDWKNIKIIQATDLHLAKRNDEMFNKINNLYRDLRKKNIKKINQIETNALKPKDKHEIKSSLFKIDLSFKKRLINPNDLFRKFIKNINRKVINNSIDFVFITGDIVDFTNLSNIESSQNNIFAYERSNWKIFKNILLNMDQPNIRGISKSEELLCPIFTIPGNHDYRPWQYDLNWGGIYKKVGLKKIEAEALREVYSASPIRAILKSEKSLVGYLSEINPSLNYYIKLGTFFFIFLDSGADSFKKMIDFISGSPSLTGLSIKQIKFLQNIIENKVRKDNQIILSIHAPPINTKSKRGIKSRIKKIFKKKTKINISNFKESNFKKFKTINKARIDDKFNITYGTLTHNLEKFIEFCAKHCILILSGHTHVFNEFRLLELEAKSVNDKNDIDNDIAVFYDKYSELYKTATKIEEFKPYVVQTPALGLKSYKKLSKFGAYRDIIIKNGNLFSFRVKYV